MGFDLVEAIVVAEGVVLSNRSLLGLSEHLQEIDRVRQGPVGIHLLLRLHREPFVPEGDELLLQEPVGFLHRRDPPDPHLLDQPVPERAEEPLYPSLRLRTQRDDQFDVQGG